MPDLTCEQCRDLLPWFARDALAPDDVAAARYHLADCADCQREYAQWQAIAAATPTTYDMIPVPSAEDTARMIAATRRRLPSQNHHVQGVSSMTTPSSEAGSGNDRVSVPAASPRAARSPVPLVAAFLLGVLVVFLAGFGYQRFATNNAGAGHKQTPVSSTVAIPDFIGEQYDAAVLDAQKVGLTLKRNDIINAAPAGQIVHQNPAPGVILYLPQQNVIQVDVSLGPPPNATAVP